MPETGERLPKRENTRECQGASIQNDHRISGGVYLETSVLPSAPARKRNESWGVPAKSAEEARGGGNPFGDVRYMS